MARQQLLAAGITAKAVRTRVEAMRLRVIHRGVYAVGHTCLTRHGEWLAAVLAAGPGAVLSHRSAAALHGLREERGTRVDVATPALRQTSTWVEVHARQTLTPADVTMRDGIPVTTVARTLVDLAGVVEPRDLARAVNEADVLRCLDVDAVLAALRAVRGRRGGGPAALRTALDAHHGPLILRQELEHRFKELIDAHALPRAEHNVRVAGWEVDACWRARRLVVELDSRRFHDTPAARARDGEKERVLRAAGWQVMRYRWRDVVGAPQQTADELRGLLSG